MKNILVVDDEWPNVNLVRKFIGLTGIEWQFNSEGRSDDAILRIIEGHYDLVITDVDMENPGAGFAVIEAVVRKNASAPSPTALMVMTGDSNNMERAKSLAPTAEFINKPFEVKGFVTMVCRLLRPSKTAP